MSESKEILAPSELITQSTETKTTLLSVCPVCGRRPTEGLVPLELLDPQLRAFVEANALIGNSPGSCSQCIALFERGRKQIEAHGTIFEQTSFVLPTPLRLNADERFTGRGVTMAFLDSGFYAHPDLTQPKDRIVAYHNIFNPAAKSDSLQTGEVASLARKSITSVEGAVSWPIYSKAFISGIAPASNMCGRLFGRSGRIPDGALT